MVDKEIYINEIVHNAIIWAWSLVKIDYYNWLICREWTLQSSMYYHLRNILSSHIDWGSLRIWCEYPLSKWDIDSSSRIDIAIIDFNQAENEKWLEMRYCVNKIYALIELKYQSLKEDNFELLAYDINKLKELTISFPRKINKKKEWVDIGKFNKYVLWIAEKTETEFIANYLTGEFQDFIELK